MKVVGGIKEGHLTINKGGRRQRKVVGGQGREDNDGDIPDGQREGSWLDGMTLSSTGSAAGTAPLPTTMSAKTTTEGGWPHQPHPPSPSCGRRQRQRQRRR